jgi:hypothetical protein
MRVPACSLAVLACVLASPAAHAGGEQVLEKVVVVGGAAEQVGIADSASVGTVTREQIEARVAYRPGELLEATPGLVVSQHSGEGKANQFYLRGFNLDHGTDLRTTVDGMYSQSAQHAHGQGWTDLNFRSPSGPRPALEGPMTRAKATSRRRARSRSPTPTAWIAALPASAPAATAFVGRCSPIRSRPAAATCSTRSKASTATALSCTRTASAS